ncbi:hypothetical protein [uncultured Apibacter sp.]|uniref:hypothetical protein n=1 Tax=uncultured Apibacter sp. TaxID=1778616 RepID=UPI0025D38C0C|nr:hypothetical protein [uncultured Apibacter sp.]
MNINNNTSKGRSKIKSFNEFSKESKKTSLNIFGNEFNRINKHFSYILWIERFKNFKPIAKILRSENEKGECKN